MINPIFVLLTCLSLLLIVACSDHAHDDGSHDEPEHHDSLN